MNFISGYSWYWYGGTKHPHQIRIGPSGHGTSFGWEELEQVRTPKEWWGNLFYMDAECRCVMFGHALTLVYHERDSYAPSCVHFSHINYRVPGTVIFEEHKRILELYEQRKST